MICYFTLAEKHIRSHFPFEVKTGACVKIIAENRDIAREIMVREFSYEWSIQYDSLDDVHPHDRDVLWSND